VEAARAKEHAAQVRYLSIVIRQKLAAAAASPLFRKGSAGILMPQPLWNIESLGNVSQIVPKGHRASESFAVENTSRDNDPASVSKGVAYETTATSNIVRSPTLQCSSCFSSNHQ
jgi:hypothetical protein